MKKDNTYKVFIKLPPIILSGPGKMGKIRAKIELDKILRSFGTTALLVSQAKIMVVKEKDKNKINILKGEFYGRR